jgi:hypothetical protein
MAHPNIVETEEALEEIVRSTRSVAVIGMKDETEPDVPAFEIPRVTQSRGIPRRRFRPSRPSASASTW